ncbi:FAD-dependent oxidoreductase [Streptomyces sp. NPDC001728]|uniref:flavin monoamine oxidase family protein n=1 Tax=Streptomyces sp. NPDC001728 TaxID=3154396 RepID=UPI00332056AD
MWDAVVVGGGVGGCYLARRLLDRSDAVRRPPRTALFEASDRLGGRLWSAPLPGMPGPVAEFGGMRFDGGEHHVVDLVEHLGLRTDAAPFFFDRPENLVHARGVRLRRRELRDPAAPVPYRLAPGERGLTGGELSLLVARRVLPEFSALRDAYDRAAVRGDGRTAASAVARYRVARRDARWRGLRLHEVPWALLLDTVLTREAAALLHDTGGYNSRSSAGSVAGTLDEMFQGAPPGGHLRLRHGFQQVPLALGERFAAAGGDIFLGHRLTGVDRAGERDGEPLYRLRFVRTDAAGAAGQLVHVLARTVVLALPNRAVELLRPGVLPVDEGPFRSGFAASRAVPAMKLFLGYPSSWWLGSGVSEGRGTTDLPLRQFWYWATGPGSGGAPGTMLAAYANGSAVDQWADLASGPPYPDGGLRRRTGARPGGGWGPEPGVGSGSGPRMGPGVGSGPGVASRLQVERAHAMLLDVHGIADAPPPVSARWQHWSVEEHGGAWPVWRPGHDLEEVIPVMRRPLPGEPVYWVNDAWTLRPGSVEGVLAAAEHVLQGPLRRARPSWLRASAAQGWELPEHDGV